MPFDSWRTLRRARQADPGELLFGLLDGQPLEAGKETGVREHGALRVKGNAFSRVAEAGPLAGVDRLAPHQDSAGGGEGEPQ